MVEAKWDQLNGIRAGIRFGIRWDDGQRPKRSVLSLVAIAAVLGLAPAAAEARPMPLAPAPVDVVVVAAPAQVDAAERLTVRLGGTRRPAAAHRRRLHGPGPPPRGQAARALARRARGQP